MILENYYNLIKCLIKNSSETFKKPDGTTIKNHLYTKLGSNSEYDALCQFGLYHRFKTDIVFLGSGTTESKPTDYNLESEIVYAGIETSYSFVESENTITKTITITNNSDYDIVVGELGTKGYVYTTKSSSTSIFFDRTVLETPVAIPKGSSAQIDYTITIE